MESFVLTSLVWGGLLPGAAVVVVLAAALPFSRHAPDAVARTAGALALGAGFSAGYFGLARAVGVSEGCWRWLPYLAWLTVGVDLADLLPLVGGVLRWALRLGVAGLTAWLLVPTSSAVQPVRFWWVGGFAASVFGLWALLGPAARRWPGSTVPLLLLAVAGAGSVVLERAGILMFVQFAGVLAAVLGGCALVSPWGRGRSFSCGMVPGVAVLLPGLLVVGYHYSASEVPWTSYALVLAAPLALWVGAVVPGQGRRAFGRLLLQTTAVLLPAALAVALADQARPTEDDYPRRNGPADFLEKSQESV